jgi:hypothetical protein
MEKVAVKLVVSNGEDFGYWKNRTMNYLLSQGRAIWEIVQTRYIKLEMLQNAIQGELQRYEKNYKTLNLITTALGRNVYDYVVLCLDSLVSAHHLIMVFIPHIGRVFSLEVFILTLSRVALTVHVFPVMVHVPLAQMVRCKRLLRLPWAIWFSAGFLRFFSLTPALSHRPFSHSM